jgi:SAM-dependent methyltransferase
MTYLLDNASHYTATRFAALSALYDGASTGHLALLAPKHARVWEVGCGSGSVARWLAQRGREVVATDVDTRWCSQVPGMTVLEHDVTTDALPGTFDVVHARLVLMHLPDPDAALRRLVQAVRPGGWLLVEELDPLMPYAPLCASPADNLANRVGLAFTAALEAAGASNTRGITAHHSLHAAGLTDVHNVGRVVVATPDSPATHLMAANVKQTRAELVRTGLVTDADLDQYLLNLSNAPDLTWCMPVMFSARGRKPTTSQERG